MKEWQRVVIVVIALYLYERHASNTGQAVDWTAFFLGAVAFELVVYALKGLAK